MQPGANLPGHIKAEESAVIGIGATAIVDRVIGHHSVAAEGSAVTRDDSQGLLVTGAPATIKREICAD